MIFDFLIGTSKYSSALQSGKLRPLFSDTFGTNRELAFMPLVSSHSPFNSEQKFRHNLDSTGYKKLTEGDVMEFDGPRVSIAMQL
jgi:hypothetical protein